MQKRIAVYTGTFDPVTLGHLWMVKVGADLFDKLVVAVGTNPDKKCYFSLEDRMTMLQESIAGYENVTVEKAPNKFIIRHAKSIGAHFILRGIRSTTDYEYEKALTYVNRQLNSDIVTVFLLPPRELIEISSSTVRGLIGPDGWKDVVANYVPSCVLERIIANHREAHASQ